MSSRSSKRQRYGTAGQGRRTATAMVSARARAPYRAPRRARARTRTPVYSPSGELKGLDTSLDMTPIVSTVNSNANAVVLNLVQQGSGSWNRVGRKIRSKSVRLTGLATFYYRPDPTTGNLVDSTMRMVVVHDKQPSGNAIPSFDSIFGGTAQDGAESTVVYSPLKYDNMMRFSTVRDITFSGDINSYNGAAGTTNSSQVTIKFDEYIPLHNHETVFGGQSDPMTIADLSSGAFYVYFRASNNSANLYWSINVSTARLRYYD